MGARICQVCHAKGAMYVCQDCGRETCSACFTPYSWLCADCEGKLQKEKVRLVPSISLREQLPLATWIFLLGFATIFVGMLMIMLASVTGSISGIGGGAVIFIGPFPILLGFGPDTVLPIVAAAAVSILAVLLFFILLGRRLG